MSYIDLLLSLDEKTLHSISNERRDECLNGKCLSQMSFAVRQNNTKDTKKTEKFSGF